MQDYILTIKENKRVADEVYRLVLAGADLPAFNAGQFVNIALPDGSKLLRRPFCIYKMDKHCLTIIYAVVGKGTELLSKCPAGMQLPVLLPLGNGFKEFSGKLAIIGGGIGAAPLLECAVRNTGETRAYLGFANASNAEVFLNDYKNAAHISIATDDGSLGEKCFPTDLFIRDLKNGYKPDVLITCGPEKMTANIQKIAAEYGIRAYMTGESHMGCGYGACLVCACKVAGTMKRACADGPVFDLSEVEL